MPLNNSFTTYDPPETAGPDRVGVYELGWPGDTDSGYVVVYIGSGDVRRRLRRHRRGEKTWAVYRCRLTGSRRRARQVERKHQRLFRSRHGRLPRFNSRVG